MGQEQVQPQRYLVVMHFQQQEFERSSQLSVLTIAELYRTAHKYLKRDMSLQFIELEREIQLKTDQDLKSAWRSMPETQRTLHIQAIQDQNAYFNVENESKLRQMMIADIFKRKTRWSVGSTDEQKKIKSYYKTTQVTQCHLYGSMPFDQTRNAFDYFQYLQCGYNNDSLWDTQVAGETVEYFDEDHQLMYSRGDAGKMLNMFIYPRDLYYMQTRFILNQNGYNMIGSLMYSINKTHPYYYKKQNKEYLRANITYRGFVLLQPENGDLTTRLVYISRFDVKGDIPHFVVKQQLKAKAVELLQHFDKSWDDKLHCLKVRRKTRRKRTQVTECALQSWLDGIGCVGYYDRFVRYGFDHLFYLRFMTQGYLEQMVGAQDDVPYVLSETGKVTESFPARLVFGFLLCIQLCIEMDEERMYEYEYHGHRNIPYDAIQHCLKYGYGTINSERQLIQTTTFQSTERHITQTSTFLMSHSISSGAI
eukprot:634418_1